MRAGAIRFVIAGVVFFVVLGRVVYAAPVPRVVRNAMTNASIAFTAIHQNYNEYGISALGNGGTLTGNLDGETGTIDGVTLSGETQHEHAGGYFELTWVRGNDAYHGHSLYDGSVADSTTKNAIFDGDIGWRYGWGFDSVPSLAIMPGLQYGLYRWRRDIEANANSENYDNQYLLGTIQATGALGRKLSVSVGYGMGQTFSARMKTRGQTYDLGSEPMNKSWLTATYMITDRFDLVAKYSHIDLKYGASAVHADNSMEPYSKTVQNRVSIGVGYRF